MEPGSRTERRWPSLASFIRANAAPIFEEWTAAVRAAVPAASQLGDPALIDRLPRVLERIAEVADGLEGRAARSAPPTSMRHALERLEEGYSLGDVVTEYSLLRDILHRRWLETAGNGLGFELVHRVIDEAITRSVDHYAQASHRMLRAVDRISTEALGNDTVDNLLGRLLRVLMEASPTVDEATILLREGDRIVVRAAAGISGERDARFSLAVGEGVAGRIVASGEPLMIRDARTDPRVVSQFLKEAGIRALYGVPLESDGEVVGVAHMGSRTAHELPDEDRMLFRAMVNRATAFIVEAQLRERERRSLLEAERARALLEGILGASVDPIAVVDRQGRAVVASAAPGPEVAGPLRRDLERCLERHVSCRGEVAGPRALEYAISPLAPRTGMEPLAIVVSRDVSDRKRADRDRERLIGILGHDLRSPLSAVQIGVEQLLRAGQLDERSVKVVRRMGTSADRMQRLIEQLVDFARGRLGRGIPLYRVPTDLRAICKAVLDEAALAHRGRRIAASLDDDMVGDWDPDRAAQVVANLVGNALEHGQDPVRVVGRGEPERVVVEVANRGAPIPPEALPTLFEPFKPRRGGARGLGLGLYIVREIVRAHGGSIDVRSSDDETVFRTTWPRRRAAAGTRP